MKYIFVFFFASYNDKFNSVTLKSRDETLKHRANSTFIIIIFKDLMNQMNEKDNSLNFLKKHVRDLKKSVRPLITCYRERNRIQNSKASDEEETKESKVETPELKKNERPINLSHLDRHLSFYFNLYMIIIFLVVLTLLIVF